MAERTSIPIRTVLKGMLLGGASGITVWLYLKVLSAGTALLWETLPGWLPGRFHALIVCTAGGLLVGLFRRKAGDYPEEMMAVLGKVRREKWYDYKKLPLLLAAAFLPLVFGSSVGPEAGLVGIITALCYWVADGLKKDANRGNAEGEQVPLATAVKRVAYSAAIAAGLGCYVVLNRLLGAAMEALPVFELALPDGRDMLLSIPYILLGCLLAKFYDVAHHGTHLAAGKLPPVVRETAAGLCLGAVATFVPEILFSGEGEIHRLMTAYGEYLPWALLGIALLKILITNLCIQSGLKGGHFFPLIYAGVAAGYAAAMLLFPGAAAGHVVFAAAVVTAAMLGANMKQPAAVVLVLLLCFPARMIFWLAIGAFAGSAAMSVGNKKADAA